MTTPLTTSHSRVLLGELSMHFSVEVKVRGYHQQTACAIIACRDLGIIMVLLTVDATMCYARYAATHSRNCRTGGGQ